MKRSKAVTTQCFPDYILSDSDIERLHKVLLMMAKDVHNACVKHGLTCFLSGGSCLGAIRHKGFIPWDDDVDFMMLRPDYDKVGEAILAEYGDKYEVVYNRSSKLDGTCCLKVYLNGTVYKEVVTEGWQKPQKIFVDIFSIESAPNSGFVRKIKGIIFDIAQRCPGLALEIKNPGPT